MFQSFNIIFEYFTRKCMNKEVVQSAFQNTGNDINTVNRNCVMHNMGLSL